MGRSHWGRGHGIQRRYSCQDDGLERGSMAEDPCQVRKPLSCSQPVSSNMTQVDTRTLCLLLTFCSLSGKPCGYEKCSLTYNVRYPHHSHCCQQQHQTGPVETCHPSVLHSTWQVQEGSRLPQSCLYLPMSTSCFLCLEEKSNLLKNRLVSDLSGQYRVGSNILGLLRLGQKKPVASICVPRQHG